MKYVIIGGGEIDCTACLKEKDGVALEIEGGEVQLCWNCLKRQVRVACSSVSNQRQGSDVILQPNGAGG